jgi:hypothetical protein
MNAALVNGVLVFETETSPEPTATETAGVPRPEDQLRSDLTEYDVSPGLQGFLVTFGVAVTLVLLLVFMSRRLRSVKYKEGAQQRVTATFDGEGPKLRSHGVEEPPQKTQ